eukprot:COSAG03_NODE_6689_length_1019_cov_1.455435_1_plen_196_part_01
MEEGTPPILAELQGLTLEKLLEKAELLGADEEALDGAESKPEVIALIVAKVEEQAAAEEQATQRARLEEELGSMTLRALHRKALQLGADKQKLDEAEDKAAVIALILELPLTNVSGSAAEHEPQSEQAQPGPEQQLEAQARAQPRRVEHKTPELCYDPTPFRQEEPFPAGIFSYASGADGGKGMQHMWAVANALRR